MFRCYSYTIIRERINLCLLKLQFLKQSIKYTGVWLIRWWCGCIYGVLIGVCVCLCVCVCVLHCVGRHVYQTATNRRDDTRGCVIQFWPPDDEHMCSKHVEAWNKLIAKQKFCASSWLITEIKITVIHQSALVVFFLKHKRFVLMISSGNMEHI